MRVQIRLGELIVEIIQGWPPKHINRKGIEIETNTLVDFVGLCWLKQNVVEQIC